MQAKPTPSKHVSCINYLEQKALLLFYRSLAPDQDWYNEFRVIIKIALYIEQGRFPDGNVRGMLQETEFELGSIGLA